MKTLLKLTTMILFLALLAACGGDKDSPKPDDMNEEEEVIDTDTTPPTIQSISPGDGDTDIAIDTNIEITFSEDIDINSVSDNTIQLGWSGSSAIGAEVTVSGNLMTIDPSSDLEDNTEYTLTLTTGITDLEGNGLTATFTSSFTTEYIDDTSPSVESFSVVNGQTDVDADASITVTFSEPVDPNSLDGILFRMGGTTDYLAISVEVSGNGVIVTPDDGMKGSTEYVLDVTVGVTDLAGNQLDFAKSRVFTTAEVPLTIVSTTPGDGGVDVEVDQDIVITFSEPLDESSVVVYWVGSSPPSYTKSVDGAVLTISPDDYWEEFETSYILAVSAANDIYGNSLSSSYYLDFTTIFVSEKYWYFINNWEVDGYDHLAYQHTSPQVTYSSQAAGSSSYILWRFIKSGDGYLISNNYLEGIGVGATYLFSFPLTTSDELAYTDTAKEGSVWTFTTPANYVRTMSSRGNLLDGQNLTMTSDQSTSSGYRWWQLRRQPVKVR